MVDNIEQKFVVVDFDEDVEDVKMVDHCNFEKPTTKKKKNRRRFKLCYVFVVLLF